MEDNGSPKLDLSLLTLNYSARLKERTFVEFDKAMFKDEKLIGVMIIPNQKFLTANNFSRTILVQATKFAEVGTHAVNLIVQTKNGITVSRSITIEILKEE